LSNDYLNSYIQLEAIAGLSTPHWIKTSRATLSDYPDPNEEIWRKKTTQLLRQLFVKFNIEISPKSFIEIGAHEASISLELKQIGISNVYAIEANPHVYNKFESNLKNSGIQYLNFAISSSSNDVEMSIPLFSTDLARADSSLLKRTANAEYKSVRINSKTLDSFINTEHLDDVSLWIDTEGLTLEVLKSAMHSLSKVVLIHTEVEDIHYWENQETALEVFQYLSNNNFVAVARDMDGRGQFNVIFVRDSHVHKLGGLISDYWKNISALKSESKQKKKSRIFGS
jgi:FkbM family methyltransferase